MTNADLSGMLTPRRLIYLERKNAELHSDVSGAQMGLLSAPGDRDVASLPRLFSFEHLTVRMNSGRSRQKSIACRSPVESITWV